MTMREVTGTSDYKTGDTPSPRRSLVRRLAPVAVIAALMALVFATGLHNYLSLTALAENRALLGEYVASHMGLSVLIFWRHRGNIARLAAGTEPRIGRKG